VHYVPREHVDPDVLRRSDHATYCPFKGDATHYDIRVDELVSASAAWTYVDPHAAVAAVKDHVAFYPDKVDAIEAHGPS
jgi:uncharacterized protein (DUF427 family)